MRRHHAEVASAYEEHDEPSYFETIADKSEFALIINSLRNPTFKNRKGSKLDNLNALHLFDEKPNDVERFTNQIKLIRSYYRLTQAFADHSANILNLTPGTSPNTVTFLDALMDKGKNPLQETGNRLSVINKKFTLKALISDLKTRDLISFCADERNPGLGDSFLNQGNEIVLYPKTDRIFDDIYSFIKTSRWVALNSPITRSDIVNTENLFSSLSSTNFTKSMSKPLSQSDIGFLFNSTEWVMNRNILNTRVSGALFLNKQKKPLSLRTSGVSSPASFNARIRSICNLSDTNVTGGLMTKTNTVSNSAATPNSLSLLESNYVSNYLTQKNIYIFVNFLLQDGGSVIKQNNTYTAGLTRCPVSKVKRLM